MESLSELAKGLAENPAAWLLALALLAIAYLYKERSTAQKEQLEMVIKQEGAHRETLMKIVPISEKLTESVEVLERVTNALLKREE